MLNGDSPESDSKASFGACSYSSRSPAHLSAGTKALNFVLPFEEALKLNVALGAAVFDLTRKNRGTPEKRRAGVKIIVHLDGKARIRVQLGKVPTKAH